MHPYITQAIAVERVKEQRSRAQQAQLAKQARGARAAGRAEARLPFSHRPLTQQTQPKVTDWARAAVSEPQPAAGPVTGAHQTEPAGCRAA
ncbi:MAG TPA: hypothetical protein VGS19_21395 [Streptosporangiaceae bacterium]|nr:hypothetical protein [Streptosporangiaceae bacterium]